MKADLNVTGEYAYVAARLVDVDPETNAKTLVARGVYRPDPDAPDGRQTFQLHPNGWRFAAGHIPQLELLGQDTPYSRPSNGTFSIEVSNLQLRLPVHEVPRRLRHASGGQETNPVMRGALRAAVGAMAVVVACVAATPAAAAGWKPGPATFGVGKNANIGVTMSDGTVLRVDVYYPTTASGEAAKGPFPVLLTQVPYGKDSPGDRVAGNAYAELDLVQRGYIEVVADVRGSGDSQGTFGLLDPVQATDGVTLVNWSARLPHSSGNVGLFGASYMGITQLMTAAAVGPHSPLKAIFPSHAANDPYRDAAFFGGVFDAAFGSIFLGGTAADNLAQPALETANADSPDPADTVGVELQHAGAVASFQGATAANFATGGDLTYEGAYWMARNPQTMLQRIVDNDIPAFLTGGWYDLFQRGEPLNYSGLQNAYAGRPVSAPMRPRQHLTGRYQLLMGPWYHSCCNGTDYHGLQLAWFDEFLKGEDTGITRTKTPLHVHMLGADKYVDTGTYPFSGAKPATLYLGAGPSGSQAPSTNDGTLSTAKPTGSNGEDPIVFTGATQPCNRQTAQWSAGVGAIGPCPTNDSASQAGPGSLTYTTAPFREDKVIAGPIAATVYATSTAPDTYLEATLEHIAAGSASSSTPITSGGLLGSFRALDARRSWLAPDGDPLLPYHPYTVESQKPVPTGKVTRFDIEVFPTFARIPAGDRLRLTITTGDSPHLAFNPSQLKNLAGGVYEVQHNAGAASFLKVPLAPAAAYTKACSLCTDPLR